MIRKGTRVRDLETGKVGVVVATVNWDRFYVRVRFPDGTERSSERVERADGKGD